MLGQLRICQLLVIIPLGSIAWAAKNEIKLPLCPRHLQFFPQDLPMHCRMPRNVDSQGYPGMPEIPEYQTLSPETQQYPFYQNPPSVKIPPLSIPISPYPQIPPGMIPGMLPGMNMPPGMRPMPGFMHGLPGPMPIPMAIPAGSPHKLPVIVMPFYSRDIQHSKNHNRHPPSKRHPHKKKYYHNSTETDADSDESSSGKSDSSESSEYGWWKGHKNKKNRKKYGISRRANRHHIIRKKKKKPELLTPILQYVTKDGYVIFEKQISKNEANDWLGPKGQAKVKKEVTAVKQDDILEELEVKANTEAEEADKFEFAKVKVRDDSKEVNNVPESPQKGKRNMKKKYFKQSYNVPKSESRRNE